MKLTDWTFAAGTDEACLEQGRPVKVPHTWNVEEGLEDYVGTAWYRTHIPAGALEAGKRTFLYFHAAYRDAEVFVNGQSVGRHEGSGYTPFLMECGQVIRAGRDAVVTVRVSNAFSIKALPYDRSFDWAVDGGLYRPVELFQTGPIRIRACRMMTRPVIFPLEKRQESGDASFGFKAELDGPTEGARLEWALYEGAKDSIREKAETPVYSGTLDGAALAELSAQLIHGIRFWHFDLPELYTLTLRVFDASGELSDERTWVTGFRDFQVHGDRCFLNGEAVRLPGMEWMPGSDPACGMAETPEIMEKMLTRLREANCVLTRFHWQQDDALYDWCDRHGILVQEEVPFWGKQPEGDPETLWPVIRRHLREMINAHRHHPSIIAWGVGNELSAQQWTVQRYVRNAAFEACRLDPTRIANYVTNTAFSAPNHDASGDGHILMINDYIGTWQQGLDQEVAWEGLLDAHRGRAFIPSEFGLCEPAFKGGDPRRERIFLEKMRFYRKTPSIIGTIAFCLNDYRTHLGEEGEGRLRRRVHGSTDLYGKPKPSYGTVQREYAPLTVTREGNALIFTCRADIPSYTVMHYALTDGRDSVPIPTLRPGEAWRYEGAMADAPCRVIRPNGDLMLEVGD